MTRIELREKNTHAELQFQRQRQFPDSARLRRAS